MTQSQEFGANGAWRGDGGAPAAGGQLTVASYPNYAEAERAVDYLSDHGFPVDRVAIVGRGLSTVERVTGRLTIWRAAGRMALSGAVTGALVGWLFGLVHWINPLISSPLLALYGLIFGAILGAVLGLVGHALTGGRRDFSSVTGMRADSYDLLVAAEVAAEASRLLEPASAAGTAPSSPAAGPAPSSPAPPAGPAPPASPGRAFGPDTTSGSEPTPNSGPPRGVAAPSGSNPDAAEPGGRHRR